ncbi:MAG: response regulator [Lachnospira sp.]
MDRADKCIKIVSVVFRILFIAVIVYFIVGQVVFPGLDSKEYEMKELDLEWTYTRESGEQQKVRLPGNFDADRNEVLTLESVLPYEIEDGWYICIRSNRQELSVYIDGELRQEYTTRDIQPFGNVSSAAYAMVSVGSKDAGKNIKIVSQTDTSYSGSFHMPYIGDSTGIWLEIFRGCGIELLISTLTIMLGVIVIIACFFIRVIYKRTIELESLGWGIVLASLWIFVNSPVRQLITPNISVSSDVAFFMVLLLPIPFGLYVNDIQKGRYKVVYMLVEILCIVDFLVCTILHVSGIMDFADTFIFMAALCAFMIITLFVTMTLDVINGNIKEYILQAVGLVTVAIFTVAQIFIYMERSITFNCVWVACSLILLLIISSIVAFRGVITMDKEKQEAIAASRAKARFLANMSHEIRTPINAVLGMDEMILRESTENKIQEYALNIQRAGNNLLSIVNEILDMSKVESGKIEIVNENYNFSNLISDVVNMVELKAKDKNLEFNVNINSKLPSSLYGDSLKIKQILVNLLNNAVKYTNEGSINFTVDGGTFENQVILFFTVRDTGIGIKEEDMPKLFAEFERIDENANRYVEGTGLGMAITRRLLELMGSTLEVESSYGVGSTFRFRLCQEVVDVQPIGDIEEKSKGENPQYEHKVLFTAPEAQVLVVDDNIVNLKVFSSLLSETKINVDTADSGKNCISYVRLKHYDVIFLDHMMPEMDGIETLKRLKNMDDSKCKDTPIIVLTANAVAGAREMYLDAGFDDFLSKPIIPDKLENMVFKYLKDELVHKEEIIIEREVDNAPETNTRSEKDDKSSMELPEIEGLDWTLARSHMSDDNMLMEIVNNFFVSLESEADYLKKRYEEIFENGTVTIEDVEKDENLKNSLDNYRIKVHAMKSSANLIGLAFLGYMARTLEYAARDGKLEVIRVMTEEFLSDWLSYKEKLKSCIQEEDGDKNIGDGKELTDILQKMETALKAVDIDLVDSLMAQVKEYKYDAEEKKLVESLNAAVTNLEEERIYEYISQLREYILHRR